MTPRSGRLISIDGPCAVGKSTTVRSLGERLQAAGLPVHLTAEPTASDIGKLARARVHSDTSGPALACLFAADRYQRLVTELRPCLAAGQIVVTDRYLASGLVVQRLDGVDLGFLQAVNALVDPPDLAVVLTADPVVITRRLHKRGLRNRYQQQPDASARETALYVEAAEVLSQSGVSVLCLDTTSDSPETLATAIHARLDGLLAVRSDGCPSPREESAS